ncbi:MAG: two-component system nitrogen regulation sensor histidine kinase GlnL [Cellvibrionaceae bacterium]|jgi:two-component system nitrogen regulation sensor histidine kinase GlnL
MGVNPDFKQLLDNLTTAVMLVDDQLRLLHMNSACETLLQVSLNHVYGTSIKNFYHESTKALEKVTNALTDESLYTKRKARWRLHNKQHITVDYTVTPLNNVNQILFEIQPLDRLMKISREEAMIASQSTTRNLIRGLAHEVKNPLGGIRGAAQLLERELDQISDNPELKEYTNVIIAESDRLRNLVDRMLGPRHIIELRPTNIHEVLERVITLITAETKGCISLKRNYDPSIPDIKGDSELLIQALLNIIHNAIQALSTDTENKSPLLNIGTHIQRQVTIGRKHYPLVCCISVNDNGPGIPPDLIDDVFYPMISGRAHGSGLGLSIAQQLINQHKGLIECASEPGDTRFSIYIPLE